MKDFILILILAIIIILAAGYIYKAKKSGKKCIGCSECCSCKLKHKGCNSDKI